MDVICKLKKCICNAAITPAITSIDRAGRRALPTFHSRKKSHFGGKTWYHCIKCPQSGRCYSQIQEYWGCIVKHFFYCFYLFLWRSHTKKSGTGAPIYDYKLTSIHSGATSAYHVCMLQGRRKKAVWQWSPLDSIQKTAFYREMSKLQSLIETTINTGRLMWFSLLKQCQEFALPIDFISIPWSLMKPSSSNEVWKPLFYQGLNCLHRRKLAWDCG